MESAEEFAINVLDCAHDSAWTDADLASAVPLVEADRAAVALAVLDEVIAACSKPMSIPFPMRAILNDMRARYQKGKSDV